MSNFIKSLVESKAEGSAENYAIEKFNAFANKKYQCKDPFRDPETNKRLTLPDELQPSKTDRKFWKQCQNKAWRDDQCFLSICGFYMSAGCLSIGSCPLVVLIPILGPLYMYHIHSKLIKKCQKEQPGLLSEEKIAKMYANIAFDLMIALPPILGTFFTWMNGCSTRNCSMIYNAMCKRLQENMKNDQHSLEVESVQVPKINGYTRTKR
ncbi:hypothetical protein ACO0R3_003151 [Hanseniaspora guilliermondii]